MIHVCEKCEIHRSHVIPATVIERASRRSRERLPTEPPIRSPPRRSRKYSREAASRRPLGADLERFPSIDLCIFPSKKQAEPPTTCRDGQDSGSPHALGGGRSCRLLLPRVPEGRDCWRLGVLGKNCSFLPGAVGHGLDPDATGRTRGPGHHPRHI